MSRKLRMIVTTGIPGGMVNRLPPVSNGGYAATEAVRTMG